MDATDPIRRARINKAVATVAVGFVLGGLLTKLAESLPESTARTVFTQGVSAEVGPFSLDLVTVAITVGPVGFMLNALVLLAIGIAAVVARSWM